MLKASHDELIHESITLNNQEVNGGNHEITTRKQRGKFFLPHRDLKHGPLMVKFQVVSCLLAYTLPLINCPNRLDLLGLVFAVFH